MAKIYYKWINAGIINIDDVPDLWKKATQKLIDQNEQGKKGRLDILAFLKKYRYVIKVLNPSSSPVIP